MVRTLLAIAVIITLLSTSCGQATSNKKTTYNTESTSTLTTQPVEKLVVQNCNSWIEYGNYIIFPSGKRYEGTFFHVIGEVKNVSSKYVRLSDYTKIEATFYDVNGSITDYDADLLTEYGFFEEEVTSPGGKWPLRLILFDEEASTRVDSYELKAIGQTTTKLPLEAEILSYTLEERSGYYNLYAEFKNTTKYPVDVKLITIFYDDKGSVIFVTSVYAAVPIAPGEKAPVYIIVAPEVQGEITSYELITRCELSSSGYTDFETFNVVYNEGVDGSKGAIIGEVRSTGDKNISKIYVYVSFYDTEGNIIGYTATRVEPETLGPGEIGAFEFSEPLSPWQMPNYSLVVRRS